MISDQNESRVVVEHQGEAIASANGPVARDSGCECDARTAGPAARPTSLERSACWAGLRLRRSLPHRWHRSSETLERALRNAARSAARCARVRSVLAPSSAHPALIQSPPAMASAGRSIHSSGHGAPSCAEPRPLPVCPMNLKHTLRDVQPDYADFSGHHYLLPDSSKHCLPGRVHTIRSVLIHAGDLMASGDRPKEIVDFNQRPSKQTPSRQPARSGSDLRQGAQKVSLASCPATAASISSRFTALSLNCSSRQASVA